MSRAFVKDANDERWQPPEQAAEFAVYVEEDRGRFTPSPVRRGDDLIELLRWASAQPRGSYQVRDRLGRPLADV
ncbi:hypothetical protein [Deinococcus peraridilitoris]|uniref:Uncharacterized protein n=1 Tax=Deinococcus peraridilitoris (strain DSM 19664 / LMG 22246 / CIP 109416 / KR-200) TaxID=937777 RepID=L0A0U0_DEIPD|nr:hypothetical protein [Deinococcus peraridilitoris]AFZ66600.1 hypothetical protein Deipe_1036 [Deinococcus peraridilitoris DSM 19664]